MQLIATIMLLAAGSVAPKVVVPALTTQGDVDAGTAAIVGELILAELQNGQQISALGPDDVAKIMDLEAQQQLLGCGSDGCLAELAGAMNADYVLAGQIGRLGTLYVLALKVIDPAQAKVVGRVTKTLENVEAIATALPGLLGGLRAKMRTFEASEAAGAGGASGSKTSGGTTPGIAEIDRSAEGLSRARRAAGRVAARAVEAAKKGDRKAFEREALAQALHRNPLPLYYFTRLRKIATTRGGFDLCPKGRYTFEGVGVVEDHFDAEGRLLLCMRVRRTHTILAGAVRMAKGPKGWRVFDWTLPAEARAPMKK